MGLGQTELELVWEGKATIGEGPAWDPRSGQLIWVDIKQNSVHLFDPAKGTNRTIRLDQQVGAAVPRERGGLVLALEHGFHLLDLETEKLTKLADPESGIPANRFNDGKCDEAGRFWAGTMDNEEQAASGSLYCLEADGSVRKEVEGVRISNGLGWSPDNRTMYYIDTPTRNVQAYDYDLATGQISNPRKVVTIPQGEGSPDGMAVDADGNLWVAQWGGWQVGHWNPATGKKLGSIPVPAEKTSSCAFGGENYDELYITTARIGLDGGQLAKQPNAGGLFRIKPGVKGLPTSFYKG